MNNQNDAYKQISVQALQACGLTSYDAWEYYQQVMSKNTGITAHGATKVGWTVTDQKKDELAQNVTTQRTENEAHFQEQQQEEQKRIAENQQRDRDQAEKAQIEERAEQERLDAARRPDEDAANRRIAGLPLGMVGALMGFGLTREAIGITGEIMSPGIRGLGDQMTVISSSGNGQLLQQARTALGVEGPYAGDTLVTGPDQTATFRPGQAPQLEGTANPTRQNIAAGPAAALPGLNGPSFGPPGA